MAESTRLCFIPTAALRNAQIENGYSPPCIYGASNSNSAWAPRHLGTMNLLFTDGHVKAMRLDDLIKTNASGFQPIFTMEDD